MKNTGIRKKCKGKSTRIKILSLSWRDIKSPFAGGAEVHTHKMLSCLDSDQFEVVHFSALYPGQSKFDEMEGVKYIRRGNVFSVILYAFLYYHRYKNDIDMVIGQCNTHQFFIPLWVHQSKRIFFIHQLTREIWDINAKYPFNIFGKRLENLFLRLNRKDYVITVSKSTKNELVKLGFDSDNIEIIYNGVSFTPWTSKEMNKKENIPTFVYVGRYSQYKGIDAAIEAVGRLNRIGIKARLWIIGKEDQQYIEQQLKPLCNRYCLSWSKEDKADIISWGFVSEEKKLELLSKATALVFPSIREGWGIPITEAAVVGTPSIVYDSPGLRDAVDNGRAGFLCKMNSVDGLFSEMKDVIQDTDKYEEKKEAAYRFSCKFQWAKSGEKFKNFINRVLNE